MGHLVCVHGLFQYKITRTSCIDFVHAIYEYLFSHWIWFFHFLTLFNLDQTLQQLLNLHWTVCNVSLFNRKTTNTRGENRENILINNIIPIIHMYILFCVFSIKETILKKKGRRKERDFTNLYIYISKISLQKGVSLKLQFYKNEREKFRDISNFNFEFYT